MSTPPPTEPSVPAPRAALAASRTLVSWSGGKDSALALHRVLADAGVRVDGLLTTVTDEYDRISMHGVRRTLLEAQAAAIGLPLEIVRIPPACSNADYEAATSAALAAYAARGGEAIVFGDLYLADIRAYRERLVAPLPLAPRFPLWSEDTTTLARRFVALGFRAVLVCVDPKQLDPRFAGRSYDDALLDELPPGVDPCGENGEFHTFVHGGPIFRHPVAITAGETVERGGFVFTDLLSG